jgi:cytochrome c-type biogenesis protein CcmE
MLKSTLAKVLLTGVLILGGGGFLVYSSLDDAQYYEMVDKVVDAPANYMDKDLKLHGYVVDGSLDKSKPHDITFALEMNGKKINIHYDGIDLPNLKARAEIVAHGKLSRDAKGDLLFQSSELMAKCPSKYQGAQSNKNVF